MAFRNVLGSGLLLFTLAGGTESAGAADPIKTPKRPFHDWAQSPPMGWNSWDCFGTQVTEQQTKDNADYMAAHMAQFGWQYIVVDIQWYEPNAKGLDYKAGAPLTMDENGRLLPATNRFPSAEDGKGFKPLADYIHGKGLKFGIHLLRGIPRQAVEKKLPILGTNFTAADVGDKKSPCKWNPDMWGVDMTKPGAQEYYDSVFKLVASWDVDFVKVDDLSRPYHKAEIEAIRNAIDKTGRPMVLSTSPGETPLADGNHVAIHANMWRMSDDFWDDWKALKEQFERCRKWAPFTRPGHFPDADMLPFGNVRAFKPDGWTRFTKDEQYTVMTLWAISRSPLMMGGHMPKNDAFTLSLLTNAEVIRINQSSTGGKQVFSRDGLIAWTADGTNPGEKYLAVFNTRDRAKEQDETDAAVEVKLEEIGWKTDATIRDLWTGAPAEAVNGVFSPKVPFHGARLFHVKP